MAIAYVYGLIEDHITGTFIRDEGVEMSTVRAFPLTASKRTLLIHLWENRDTEDGELVCSIPGGWWLGKHKQSGNLCTWLLRYSLVRIIYTNSENGKNASYTVFVAARELGQLLADSGYMPQGAVIFD